MNRKPNNKVTRMSLRDAQAADSQTDWQRLKDMSDEAISSAAETDLDNLPLYDPFFETARRLAPSALLKEAKQQITLRIDADVLEWFRASGAGYQSRMNAVLKAYVQTHGGHNSQL
ncbi:BrnA antitoxin family protein [Desulfovibrio sp. OttesenSCG-928-G11]|nr:BrnA antitoxin family protein [Desulfovibrio sp. OttesenSCG-928-G11]